MDLDRKWTVNMLSHQLGKNRPHPVAAVKGLHFSQHLATWISPRKKGLSSRKMLGFPPVAGAWVDVCGCKCTRPDGLITVASALSGMLSLHPPPHPPISNPPSNGPISI